MILDSPELAEPEQPISRRVFLTVFSALTLPLFLGMVDQTIVATALPSIAADLGEVERASWIVVSYLVAATIGAAVCGRLGDTLGRKRLMFWAVGIFMGASVLCASARSIEMLTLARVIQGLGGGGLYTLSQSLLGETVSLRQRVRFQAYISGLSVAALSVGPLAGGVLTDHFGWRSIFIVNVPVGLLAMLILTRLRASRGTGRKAGFDWTGLGLFALFVAPSLVALEQVWHIDSRTTPMILGLLAIGVIALALLYRQERRTATPLFPLAVLGEASIWRCSAVSACHGAAMISLLTFVPIYLRVVRGVSATDTAFLILPLTIIIPGCSALTSRLISFTGRTADIPSWSLAIPTLSLAAVALWAPDLGNVTLSAAFGVASIGLSSGITVAQVIVQIVGGQRMLGVSAAAIDISRSVGAAFGTAAVAAVLFALLAYTGQDNLALFARLIQEGPAVMDSLAADRQALLRAAIAHAFSWAYLVIAGFTGLQMVLCWTIPSRRL